MHALLILSGAFGHRGGIAKFNRDLCGALSSVPLSARLTVLPRVPPEESVENVPDLVSYHPVAAGSKVGYVWSVLRGTAALEPAADFVLCGHINLLPVAAIAARMQDAPLLLVLHGVDAWEPHDSPPVRWSIPEVDVFVSVSRHTEDRFLDWAPLSPEQGHVIPNCIDLGKYSPGPKRDHLLDRYGLHEQTILLTLGRLSSEERYKGHDEILEVLPELVEERPDVAYLVCGDGDDRPRLEHKAEQLGIADRVVFAGYVPEEEKEDHYRLADAFVMPGRGEGFGIVYLEAMACGVPVVASRADGSREALCDGKLGVMVNPSDATDLIRGIQAALDGPRGTPEGLAYFSCDRFRGRWHRCVREQIGAGGGASDSRR